jgi:hypothetical protein
MPIALRQGRQRRDAAADKQEKNNSVDVQGALYIYRHYLCSGE